LPRPLGARPHQREPALIRPFFTLLGGLAGSVIGAPLFALAFAAIFTEIYGPFEGSAAMGGGMIGSVTGVAVGFIGGVWAVLRDDAKHAGAAVAWLGVGVGIVLTCIAYVAFS
jgi:hypothetical protein